MRGTAASNTDYNVNDVAPTIGTPATLFPAYFAPDTPSFSELQCLSSSYRGQELDRNLHP